MFRTYNLKFKLGTHTNHGIVIEGSGKAVLYTGDIRSEPWFVNGLTRHPVMLPYTSGLKRLDCIYLDTSHTEPIKFPTKAEGLKELLQKVSQYPPDTVFHFSAWTFGYELVWIALSAYLESRVGNLFLLCRPRSCFDKPNISPDPRR